MTYDQYRRELAAKILQSKLARDDNDARLERYARHQDEWRGR